MAPKCNSNGHCPLSLIRSLHLFPTWIFLLQRTSLSLATWWGPLCALYSARHCRRQRAIHTGSSLCSPLRRLPFLMYVVGMNSDMLRFAFGSPVVHRLRPSPVSHCCVALRFKRIVVFLGHRGVRFGGWVAHRLCCFSGTAAPPSWWSPMFDHLWVNGALGG